MSTIVVTTQAELDAALVAADAETEWTTIEIRSTPGVWLTLSRTPGSSSVVAWGSSSVVARGSSSVEARESSSVVARGSSSVEARESSSVVARESSSVVARGSSSVVAWGSSSVVARGSSRVVAWGSSSVVAWGSSSVVARESSSVEARESSSVEARESSSVVAGDYVAVRLHSARATVEGGVLIDVTALDETDVDQWTRYHGAQADGDHVVLYKAVGDDYTSERGFAYPPGTTVEAPDWTATNDCVGGLHLSPSASCARDHYWAATRFLRCRVHRDDLRPIPGGTAKAKARRVEVLAEVDIHGDDVAVPS